MNIKTVQDLLNILSDIKQNYGEKSEYGGVTPSVNGSLHPDADFVFRGLSNKDFKLIPKIFRNGYNLLSYDEPLERFKKEANSYLYSKCGDDKLLWMQYAQHFGVPTRLLDFSSNPLVALYFACNGDESVDGSLWIINEFRFNCHTSFEYCKAEGKGRDREIDILHDYLEQSSEDEYNKNKKGELPIIFFQII
ncbi:FRG domain-containing protein [Massilicoli timonensis]|uniref:FRG domain-containing protein n=1 Tax=Massilicoli timonensis TaxID=2015901 RepID=UPI000C826243|nr:FRG domain-containing protein [Massilicoli timonensis]